MKIIFLTLSLLLCGGVSFSQESVWTKQSKISEVIAFERKLDPDAKFLSQNVSLSKDYYPLADRYQTVNPVIVQRKALSALPLYAEYFFTPKDSLLRLVSYDWEKGRYGDLKDILESRKEQGGKLEVYTGEYERIRVQLIKTFGKPAQADEKPKTVDDEGQKYLNQNTLWETQEVHADLNLIFSAGTQRIRLTLYWKK
ncbi:hypothetical protein [Pedobacter miscanthi]|uniref:Uncharacterized protein n=1 Tax=Pedobacter miscanthi TaxID=2259170 RepID=A0A366LC56_9SPHI|nr:hypothetical protein [Pedobacter miscanthi]RBQ11471.1 hypothetical protein DRW42_03130 [Pedobacter miscanthi]